MVPSLVNRFLIIGSSCRTGSQGPSSLGLGCRAGPGGYYKWPGMPLSMWDGPWGPGVAVFRSGSKVASMT